MNDRLQNKILLPIACMVSMLSAHAQGAALSSPPTVLFGKVIHVGEGSSYQVYDGTITLELVRDDDPTHVISLTTSLDQFGSAGEVSYRIEIPHIYLPNSDERSENIEIAFENIGYTFRDIQIDGVDGTFLDASQALLSTHFADHALEHQLDIEVNLPQVDSDGDGIPDWWEELYGLNIYLSADALLDLDGDLLDNLGEFLAGSDPTIANTLPLFQTTALSVPMGGQGGFYVGIMDLDTPPEELELTFNTLPAGLTLKRNISILSAGSTVSYADVLAGRIRIAVGPSFETGTMEVSVTETTGAGDTADATLSITVFSPATLPGISPAIWLDSGLLATGTPVPEWSDRSGNQRDAYQPISGWTPSTDSTAGEGIQLEDGSFFYLDDRGLDASEITAFFAFKTASLQENQTLLHMGDMQVAVGGQADPEFANSIKVTTAGRQLRGPLLNEGQLNQLTVSGGTNATHLNGFGDNFVASTETQQSGLTPASFSTIGAHQRIEDAQAAAFLEGMIHEVILYDAQLPPELLIRNEDYQHSRWGSLTVWDLRGQVIPLTLSGHAGERNAINGGWGNDTLTGGILDDILRGGPGTDRLTGGLGADRFQLFKNQGDDTITDFDPSEGDVLDLTGIFGHLSGTPDQFMAFQQVIVRLDGELPRVDSILELDYDGAANGWNVDQTITFENQNFGNNHLAQLTGEKSIVLGMIHFDTAISVAAETTELLENGQPYAMTVTRAGNLDAALDVELAFSGDALIDTDYQVSLSNRTGSVRLVHFDRGQSEASFDLVPVVDQESETEQIFIAVLADARLTTTPATPLVLTLVDVPHFAVQTRQHATLGPSGMSGLVAIIRSGPGIAEAAQVRVDMNGPLGFEGADETTTEMVQFAAGEIEVLRSISATGITQTGNTIEQVEVRVIPDSLAQAAGTPATAYVLFLPTNAIPELSFANWAEVYFPGMSPDEIAPEDANQNGEANLFEYIYGTAPTSPGSIGTGKLAIQIQNGKAVLTLDTTFGWVDVHLGIQHSLDLTNWVDATDAFDFTLSMNSDDRARRTYSSKAGTTTKGFYRLVAFQTAEQVSVIAPYAMWSEAQDLTPAVNDGSEDNPDGDNWNNRDEFALDGDPLNSADNGKIKGTIADVAGDNYLVHTFPVLRGTSFSATPHKEGVNGDILYVVSGATNLTDFNEEVVEVIPALTAGMPALNSGWEYRSFRFHQSSATASKAFIKIQVKSSAP